MTETPSDPVQTAPVEDPVPVQEPAIVASAAPAAAPPVTSGKPRRRFPFRTLAVAIVLLLVAVLTAPWWLTLAGAPEPLLAVAREATSSLPQWARPPEAAPAAPIPAAPIPAAPTPVAPATPEQPAAAPVAAPPPPETTVVNDQLRDLAREMADLRTQTAALAQRLDSAPLDTILARLAGLEARLDRIGQGARSDAALVLAAGEIQQALAAGAPYAAPLAVIRAEAPDDTDLGAALDTLSERAAAGVPTRWALAQTFDALTAHPTQSAATADSAADFWQRLWTRLSGVVTISHVAGSEPAGTPDYPETRIARARTALAGGDLGVAIAAISAVGGDAAARFQPWLKEAVARQQAEAAAETVRVRLTARLAGTGKPG